MTDFDVKEKRFEQDIEEYLCSVGGYTKGSPAAFDRTLALDKATLLSFIQSTQPKEWENMSATTVLIASASSSTAFAAWSSKSVFCMCCATALTTGESSFA